MTATQHPGIPTTAGSTTAGPTRARIGLRARLRQWFTFDPESLANACIALSAPCGALVPYYLLLPEESDPADDGAADHDDA